MELPVRFEERMRLLLGDEEWRQQAAVLSAPLTARGLRVNTLKITAQRLLPLLAVSATPVPFAVNGYVIEEALKAGGDPLHHGGAYYMQEPSAMSAVTVLAPRPGERILDLCAAPGGKSTQIAATMQGEGLLWCNEYVPARARVLAQNLERCGVRNSVVSVGDTARLAQRLPDWFDGVLADVPCSGEGMFRKEPEALAQWSEDNIALCATRGQEILHNAAQCVRPGGRLVLSTCTCAPEDNEWAVVRFLQTHPDFELVDSGVTFGCGGFDGEQIAPFGLSEERQAACEVPLSRCRRLLPAHGGEGHFIALFRRQDTAGCAAVSLFSVGRETDGIKAARALYEDCFVQPPVGILAEFGEMVRLLPREMPETNGITVLCAGVTVAQLRAGGRTLRAEPDHGVFQSARVEDCRRVLSLSLTDPRLFAFLRGEEVSADLPGGYTGVACEGVLTGYGKAANGRLKNHYPKGLRLVT